MVLVMMLFAALVVGLVHGDDHEDKTDRDVGCCMALDWYVYLHLEEHECTYDCDGVQVAARGQGV